MEEEAIFIAACDLDKTVYPPAGPHQLQQLHANVEAMAAFEETGGLVFPVTGNNLLMAQAKFDVNGERLRDLGAKPGVFMNGGLVLGPEGKELERHALGHLHLTVGGATVGSDAVAAGPDVVTAMVRFFEEARNAPLVERLGLLFFTPTHLLTVASVAANTAEYCRDQRVPLTTLSRDEVLDKREEMLLLLVLFPTHEAGGGAPLDYETVLRPWQERIKEAMEAAGILQCRTTAQDAPPGVGQGLKLTLQSAPWPEIDVNVAGVDKGTALARFLEAPSVKDYLGIDRESKVQPAKHVAVFGDAANDVPMFEAIGGERPGLRVAMPHATDASLNALANERGEVSEVLQRLSAARRAGAVRP
mmetsp:Transcript_22681/g.61426  ORF Transcript_22681/g.61426 Transcript_22681/m.61426 type:complete len:360 (+) Transcript_22681:146-1225(+)